MLAASPPVELQTVTDAAASAISPAPPPAIRIEKECLHDAEEAGKYFSILVGIGAIPYFKKSWIAKFETNHESCMVQSNMTLKAECWIVQTT